MSSNMLDFLGRFYAGEFGHNEEQIERLHRNNQEFIDFLYIWRDRSSMPESSTEGLPDEAYRSAVEKVLYTSSVRANYLDTSV